MLHVVLEAAGSAFAPPWGLGTGELEAWLGVESEDFFETGTRASDDTPPAQATEYEDAGKDREPEGQQAKSQDARNRRPGGDSQCRQARH